MAPAEVIQKNYNFLMDNLYIEESLITQLRASSVLDHYDMSKIEAETFSFRKLERFLDAIMRKSPHQFKTFLQVLRDAQQEHVATALLATSSVDSKNGKLDEISSSNCVRSFQFKVSSNAYLISDVFAYQCRPYPWRCALASKLI